MVCPILSLPQPSLHSPPSDSWLVLWVLIAVFLLVVSGAIFISTRLRFSKILGGLLVLPGLCMMMGAWVIDFCIMRPYQDITIDQWEESHTIFLSFDCFQHYHAVLYQTVQGLMRGYTALATGSLSVISLGYIGIRVLAQRQHRREDAKKKAIN